MDLNQKALLNRLVENKDVSKEEADQIEVESLKKNLAIKDYLFEYGQIPRQNVIKAQSQVMGVPYVDLENSPIDSQAIGFLEKKTGKKIRLALADEQQIAKMVDLAYSQGLSPEVRDALKEYTPA